MLKYQYDCIPTQKLTGDRVHKEKGCMSKKYKINLSEEQRQELLDLVKKGSAKARTIRRAHTLLMAADGKTDEIIAETLHVSVATVERTRKQFCCENLAATLTEKKRPGKPQKLNNYGEAYLIATTCSDAPAGSTRWTLRMLASQLVSLEIVDSLSKSTVGRILKKTNCDRNLNQVCVDWRFRTEDARVKLSKIYPTQQN